MTEQRLTYVKNKDEAFFYFGDFLIFRSCRSMPFVLFERKCGDAVVYDSLDKTEIARHEDNISVTFSDGAGRKAYLEMMGRGNIVRFNFSSDADYDRVRFCLCKSDEKVCGIPAYNAQKRDKDAKFSGVKNIGEKLGFYVSGAYLFENLSIFNYECKISDCIYISTPSRSFGFKLVFARNIYAAINCVEQSNKKIKKYSKGAIFLRSSSYDYDKITAFEKRTGKKVVGMAIDRRVYDEGLMKIELRKSREQKKECVFVLDKTIDRRAAHRFFSPDEFVALPSGLVRIKTLNTEKLVREYLVIARKCLDLGADGIYFSGEFANEEMNNIKFGMRDLVSEYPECALFHDIMTDGTSDFGYYIIRDKEIIRNYSRYSPIYLYSGEFMIGKEEDVLSDASDFAVNIVKI